MRQRVLTLAAAATLLVAACGGSDDAADEPEPETEPAESEAEAEPEPETAPADEPEPEPETAPADEPEPEPEPAGPATVESDDGALRLEIPEGSPDVTIADGTVTGPLEVGGVTFETLASYDLGPDGAEFETPVVANFLLDDSVAESSVIMVLHRRGDEVESLPIEFTEDGFRTQLDSFSEAEVLIADEGDWLLDVSPPEDFSEAPLDNGLDLDVLFGLKPANDADDSGDSAFDWALEDVSFDSADVQDLCGADPDSFPGLSVEMSSGDRYAAYGQSIEADVSALCGSPPELVDVFPDDVRCQGSQGELLEGVCPTGEQLMTAVASDAESVTVEVTVPTDQMIIFGLGGPTSDESFRFVEAEEAGTTNGFYDVVYLPYQPSGPILTTESTDLGDGTRRVTGVLAVPCDPSGTGRTFPDGVTPDGTVVDAAAVEINELTLFFEGLDALGIYYHNADPTSAGPGNLGASGALATC